MGLFFVFFSQPSEMGTRFIRRTKFKETFHAMYQLKRWNSTLENQPRFNICLFSSSLNETPREFLSQISECFICTTNFRISEQWLCFSRFIEHQRRCISIVRLASAALSLMQTQARKPGTQDKQLERPRSNCLLPSATVTQPQQ